MTDYQEAPAPEGEVVAGAEGGPRDGIEAPLSDPAVPNSAEGSGDDRPGYSQTGQTMAIAISIHFEQIDALGDLFFRLADTAKELDDPRSAVRDLVRPTFASRQGSPPSEPPSDVEIAAVRYFDALLRDEGRSHGVEISSVPRESVAETEVQRCADSLVESCEFNLPHVIQIISRLKRLLLRRERSHAFVGAIVIAAVAAVEQLFGRLLRALYVARPGIVSTEDAKFSLAQIRQFESIEAAFESLVDARASDDLRGGPAVWATRLKDGAGVDLKALLDDWGEFSEIYERRNVLVHHDGRVSQQYIKKLKRSDLKIGDALVCDRDYVERVLDVVLASGLVAAVHLWQKLVPEEKRLAADAITDPVLDLMGEGRWAPVEMVCARLKGMCGTEGDKWVSTVNWWIARGQTKGMESIRREVSEWDTSALAMKFTVARLALLGNHDEVIDAIPHLVLSGEIKQDDAELWPLFSETRQHPRWAEVSAAFNGTD